MKPRILKILLALTTIIFAWLIITGSMIWSFANKNNAKKSDCIIVLGAAVYGNKPSPVFEERINHSIKLFKEGSASIIIFTGGFGNEATHSESEVGKLFAINAGIGEDSILTEVKSKTTNQNLIESKHLMDANGLNSALIVSDPLHLKRASVMARDLGMIAVTSPTPTSRYQSLKTKIPFLVREIYFYNHYLVIGK